jgi:anti-sigma factor RsiW
VSRGHAIACAECRELLGGYVLDALEPDETELVRAHVAGCRDCAREHAELAAIPPLLAVAGSADTPTAKPPAALEDAVLDRFARERPRPEPEGRRRRRPLARHWLTRPLPVAAAAATVAVLATLAFSARLSDSGSSSAHAYSASLRGLALAPDARAYARLSTQSAGTRVELHVRGMSPAPGAVYELWCVGRDGTRVSAGTFRVDRAGRASVRLTTGARLGEYDRLSVERIAQGGRGAPVMAGAIEY